MFIWDSHVDAADHVRLISSRSTLHHALRHHPHEPRRSRTRLGGLLQRRERRIHVVRARKRRWPGSRRARSCLQSGADDVRAGGAPQVLPEPGVRVRVGLELPDPGESCAGPWVEAQVHDGGHVEERQGRGRDVPQEVNSKDSVTAGVSIDEIINWIQFPWRSGILLTTVLLAYNGTSSP